MRILSSAQRVDLGLTLEGAEQGELTGAALGAVVETVRQLCAQVAAAGQSEGPVVGERRERAEVDVDALRVGKEGAHDGVDEVVAGTGIEMAVYRDGDVVVDRCRAHQSMLARPFTTIPATTV